MYRAIIFLGAIPLCYVGYRMHAKAKRLSDEAQSVDAVGVVFLMTGSSSSLRFWGALCMSSSVVRGFGLCRPHMGFPEFSVSPDTFMRSLMGDAEKSHRHTQYV